MYVDVEPVGHGASARAALVRAIATAKRQDDAAIVTVCAPNLRAATSLRHDVARAFARDGKLGVANVRFGVLARICELAGSPAFVRRGCRPLDRTSLGAAMRAALADHRGFLTRVVKHQSTESELVSLYEQTRLLPSDAFERMSSIGPRAAELAQIFHNVRARLRESTFDDVDLCDAAANAVADASVRARFGTVIIHLPQRLRHAEADLLAALAQRGPVVLQVGASGEEGACTSRQLLELLSKVGALEPREEQLGFDLSTAIRDTLVDRVVVAPDPGSEVRAAVRVVVERLRRGVDAERLAICYPRPAPYARLIADELRKASVVWNGPSPDVLAATPVARFVLGLCRLDPRSLGRTELVELISSAPLMDGDGRAIRGGEWERCMRLTGLTRADAGRWRNRIIAIEQEATSELRRLSPGEGDDGVYLGGSLPSRLARARRTQTGCREFRRFFDDLLAVVEALRDKASWAQRSSALRDAVARFVITSHEPEESSFSEARRAVEEVLDELSLLDELCAAEDVETFASALETAVSRPGPRVGRFDVGVVVGDLDAAAGLDLELLVVLGAAEGDLPGGEHASALLSAAQRELLGLDATSRSTIVADDGRRLRVASASAKETIATFPQFDSPRGRVRIISRFVAATKRRTDAPSSTDFLQHVSNGAMDPLSLAELCFASLMAHRNRGALASDHQLAQLNEALAVSIRATESRNRYSFDRFGGRIRSVGLGAALFSEEFAPTTLEQYATCPFRYLLTHELRCEVIDEPEQRLSIDPRVRGIMAHEILERFVAGQLASFEGGASTGSDDCASAARLVDIANDVFGRFERLGLTGAKVLWEPQRRRLLADLEAERQLDAARRLKDGVYAVAVEHEFGMRGGIEPVSVQLSSGPLRFRGKIDRIDKDDRRLCVVDYKTGRPDFYRSLEKDALGFGRHLQLPVYALAARQAFASEASDRVLEARYRFVGQDRDVSFSLDDKSSERFTSVLETLLASIREGLFPMHPGEYAFGGHENCRFCDFDALCPSDRAKRWERAIEDPKLKSYVELTTGVQVPSADREARAS